MVLKWLPWLIAQETKAQNEALAQLSRKLQSTEARRSSAGTGTWSQGWSMGK